MKGMASKNITARQKQPCLCSKNETLDEEEGRVQANKNEDVERQTNGENVEKKRREPLSRKK